MVNYREVLTNFIDRIKTLNINISDKSDEESNDETVQLTLEDLPDCTLEINRDLTYMDIYCSFIYDDYSNSDRESRHFCDVINEIHTYYIQKSFENAINKLSIKMDVWDDGCYMCYGYSARVGFYHVPCNVEIVRVFVEKAKQFFTENYIGDLTEILKIRLQEFFQAHSIKEKNLPFSIDIRNNINYKPLPESKMIFYIGEDNVLFKTPIASGAICKNHYDLFMSAVEEIEYFTDTYFEVRGDFIHAVSCSFCADIPFKDINSVIDFELAYLDVNSSRLGPFLIRDYKKLTLPHIYTEGHTDWRHIECAMRKLAPQLLECLVFEKYSLDTDMGDTRLLEKCKILSDEKDNPNLKIMIFDRDNIQIIKLVDDETKGFKDWGNRVYSFAIPVPKHREDTPMISIEHYYTDSEIMSEVEVEGIKRRLYFGYEFDSIGRAPHLSKICRSLNKCGEKKLTIIDDHVYDSNSLTLIDYALSKSKFVDYISGINISNEATDAFVKLFSKIKQIIEYDKNKLTDRKVTKGIFGT